jgi:isopenicillin-N epimerase
MSCSFKASFASSIGRRHFCREILGGIGGIAVAAGSLNAGIYKKLEELDRTKLSRQSPDGPYWEAIANQYMFEPGLIMMNNGKAGAMPRVVYRALAEYFRIQAENPYKCYSNFDAYREDARLKAAQFIRSDAEETTLLRNTTEGLSIIAYGVDMKPGDEVLMSNLEHPAGIYPWKMRAKRSGISIKEARLNIPPKDKDEILNAFNDAITPKTRIILVSHLVFHTGLVTPIKEICALARSKNILVAADGAHCVGMLDIDVHDLGVDFYANSGYKWLGAPTGTGLFYVRNEIQKDVLPNIVEVEWEKHPTALKYSFIGRTSDPLYIALGEAIRLQNAIRKDRIERRIKTLAAYLKEQLVQIPKIRLLTPQDPSLSGGLTVFGVEGVKNINLVNYLQEKYNIVVAPIFPEKNAIRVSTHIWITFGQIDLLAKGIREFVS